MSEPKGKYFNPEKAEIYRAADALNEKIASAIEAGDWDLAKRLSVEAKAKRAQLAGSRGSSTLLTEKPDAVLKMQPEEGQALVIIKTQGGTECRKVSLKKDLKYKRVSVDISEIWCYKV